jgi:formate-dependent nitrite reductase membrane component NrfD/ferredoxin
MYQRPDGLVDFDHDACIGCKACMQACPYDAIYMDPDSNTAAKCNFCSHRVDEGLLPACVVVCPEEALLFGDLEDPASKVSRALKEHDVSVRRPEQGTHPHAFYIGAHDATLEPLAARHDATYMWSDRGARDQRERTPLPIYTGKPSPPARVAYDVPRQRTWGWPVSSYIWTKGIAAGLGMLAGIGQFVDLGATRQVLRVVAPIVALIFLAITGALLVGDLKRPERFWTILTRPQWRSWLARGAVIISIYGALLIAWLALEWLNWTGVGATVAVLLIVGGAFTAGYTAPLLAQCEGRDLWQSRLLLPHLLVHAFAGGLAVLILVDAASGIRGSRSLIDAFVVAAIAAGALALADGFKKHHTSNAAAAAHALTRGTQSRLFWLSLVLGVVLAVPLAFAGLGGLLAASLLALGGLWLHGHAFILAGQGPPIS